jgi:hypothetical protein
VPGRKMPSATRCAGSRAIQSSNTWSCASFGRLSMRTRMHHVAGGPGLRRRGERHLSARDRVRRAARRRDDRKRDRGDREHAARETPGADVRPHVRETASRLRARASLGGRDRQQARTQLVGGLRRGSRRAQQPLEPVEHGIVVERFVGHGQEVIRTTSRCGFRQILVTRLRAVPRAPLTVASGLASSAS